MPAAPPRPGDRAPRACALARLRCRGPHRRGLRCDALKQRRQQIAMRVAILVYPFLLDAGEQIPSAQLERLVEPLMLDEVTERDRVDPQPGPPKPTRSRVATSASDSAPSDRRIAQIAFRKLARALESSTCGQNRPATSARWWLPGLSASQASSERARHDPRQFDRSASRSRPPARPAGGSGACGKRTVATVPRIASFHGCCDGG